jgi:uncharacterized protein YndB with AHSA1/START domain
MKAFINSFRNKFLLIIIAIGIFAFISNYSANAGIYSSNINCDDLFIDETQLIDNVKNKSNMDTIVKLDKHMTFVHEVDIKTSPDKIWDFLININENYSVWHPKDHILFQWTKGAPFETGSTFYAEQYMMGEKVKYNGKITESIPGEKITMTFSFPLSLITEKIEMIIENKGTYSKFKHITYMKFKFLSRTIFKKQNIKMLNDMDAHIRTEGGNMKDILENVK